MSPETSLRKEPVAFDQIMEGLLLHAMKGRLDGEARRRLLGIGVDVDQPLSSAYPLTVMVEAIRICADVLYPDQPRDEAWYLTGRRALEGFGSTAMGKALFGMARVWGPRKLLGHMTRALQTAINYARAHAVDLPNGDVELTAEILPDYLALHGKRRLMDPHFLRGIIAQLVEVGGARAPVVLVTSTAPQESRYVYRVSLSQAQPLPPPPAPPRA
ncbi:DUF2378 family protein [Stigmatella erecta]|uniref:Myxococcales-restricted protein, TIGR02265 family n=1 Tax=Stigmatella erecta TaxID=83460 RepID=A0A1I0ISP4_9BACT|nr:DUF2378 family protein [Stigmatella erecta]SEU00174.1 Myxococcales-restricted protein, TIGR02265 family [Stigmatella erecta]